MMYKIGNGNGVMKGTFENAKKGFKNFVGKFTKKGVQETAKNLVSTNMLKEIANSFNKCFEDILNLGEQKLNFAGIGDIGDDVLKNADNLDNNVKNSNLNNNNNDNAFCVEIKSDIITERLKHNQKTPGKIEGDYAGHLVGDRFGGSPEIDNLASQTSKNNLSNFKKLENEWAKAIKENKKVEVNISIEYNKDDIRPSKFIINYCINGNKSKVILKN